MAKPEKNGKFHVKKAPSEAELAGEYAVPPHQQVSVRELDNKGAELQKQLGALRIDYLVKESELMRQFQQNRVDYEKTVTEVAKVAGIDLKIAAEKKQPWTFDLSNMTFKRSPPPAPAPNIQ